MAPVFFLQNVPIRSGVSTSDHASFTADGPILPQDVSSEKDKKASQSKKDAMKKALAKKRRDDEDKAFYANLQAAATTTAGERKTNKGGGGGHPSGDGDGENDVNDGDANVGETANADTFPGQPDFPAADLDDPLGSPTNRTVSSGGRTTRSPSVFSVYSTEEKKDMASKHKHGHKMLGDMLLETSSTQKSGLGGGKSSNDLLALADDCAAVPLVRPNTTAGRSNSVHYHADPDGMIPRDSYDRFNSTLSIRPSRSRQSAVRLGFSGHEVSPVKKRLPKRSETLDDWRLKLLQDTPVMAPEGPVPDARGTSILRSMGEFPHRERIPVSEKAEIGHIKARKQDKRLITMNGGMTYSKATEEYPYTAQESLRTDELDATLNAIFPQNYIRQQNPEGTELTKKLIFATLRDKTRPDLVSFVPLNRRRSYVDELYRARLEPHLPTIWLDVTTSPEMRSRLASTSSKGRSLVKAPPPPPLPLKAAAAHKLRGPQQSKNRLDELDRGRLETIDDDGASVTGGTEHIRGGGGDDGGYGSDRGSNNNKGGGGSNSGSSSNNNNNNNGAGGSTAGSATGSVEEMKSMSAVVPQASADRKDWTTFRKELALDRTLINAAHGASVWSYDDRTERSSEHESRSKAVGVKGRRMAHVEAKTDAKKVVGGKKPVMITASLRAAIIKKKEAMALF